MLVLAWDSKAVLMEKRRKLCFQWACPIGLNLLGKNVVPFEERTKKIKEGGASLLMRE
jgi:hypothetical protein